MLLKRLASVITAKTIEKCQIIPITNLSQTTTSSNKEIKFETVYTFPHIKYFAMFNRLKIYHLIGSSIAMPSCGILEFLDIFPQQSSLVAAYIGVTGAAVLLTASWPFKDIIGFLYISEDNKHIKISSLDFWGRRIDKVVPAEQWIPLLDMTPKKSDILYLTPELTDKSKYKWFVKFGQLYNKHKIGEVLE